MGKPKKYLIKSVNFGKVGERSRGLIEEYIKKYGNNKFSHLCRRAVIGLLSNNQEENNFKKKTLLIETKEIFKETQKLVRKRDENVAILKEIGANQEEIDSIYYAD